MSCARLQECSSLTTVGGFLLASALPYIVRRLSTVACYDMSSTSSFAY